MNPGNEFHLPLSDHILRALVDAFDLREYDAGEDLRSPTGRRWLDGEVFNVEKRASFQDAVIRALIESGVLAYPPDVRVEGLHDSTIWTVLFGIEVSGWDRLVGQVNGLPHRTSLSREGSYAAVLRLVAVSVALREAAWRRLGKVSVEGVHPLKRAFVAPGAHTLLREWFDHANRRITEANATERLTRDAFASAVGVTPGELDAWLDGRHTPKRASQEALAGAFEVELGRPASEFLRALRIHIGLSRLLDRLSGTIGRAFLAGIAEHYVSLVPRLMSKLDLLRIEDPTYEALSQFLTMAVGHESPHRAVLVLVAREETNPLWKQIYADVLRPWDALLAAGVGGIADVEAAARAMSERGVTLTDARGFMNLFNLLLQIGMADDVLEALVRDLSASQRAELEPWLRERWNDDPVFELLRAVYLLRIGDREGAFVRMDRLADRLPTAPGMLDCVVQFALMAGLVEEADRIATRAFETAGPSPELDFTRAQVALFRHQPDRAIALLEPLVRARPDHVDALYMLAAANERIGRFREALGWCEAVLKLAPQHVNALRAAEGLSERLGEKRLAATYEKRLRVLGQPPRSSWTEHLLERLVQLLSANHARGKRDV